MNQREYRITSKFFLRVQVKTPLVYTQDWNKAQTPSLKTSSFVTLNEEPWLKTKNPVTHRQILTGNDATDEKWTLSDLFPVLSSYIYFLSLLYLVNAF